MKTSGDTLLRMIRRQSNKIRTGREALLPKVIGARDWAWRKGCTYGTIIVDLERRNVIDLLPDREAETLTGWLLAHPSVETVARDRSPIYRNGIMLGKPYATQIADRWHLLSNLGTALEKMVERLLRKRSSDPHPTTESESFDQNKLKRGSSFEPLDDWQWNHQLQKAFQEMKLNACRNRLLPHLPTFPKPGEANRKINSPPKRKKPFKADAGAISRFCFQKRKLSDEEINLLCDARAEWDEFDRAYPLVEEFVRIVRRQGSIDIGLWIVRAFNSGVKELKSFANGLQKDFLAVKEATVSDWSNGQTEGQVNRLKLLKRQMYGRAKFDLLKARVLNPA
jgi:transposase